MNELTKAEEQIMRIIWVVKRGFVKDFIEKLPDPKPAYNTVSTIVRILEKKGFVKHDEYGNTYQYFPVISQDEYASVHLKGFVKNYFSSSFKQLTSFFAGDSDISIADLEAIKKIMEEEIKKKKVE